MNGVEQMFLYFKEETMKKIDTAVVVVAGVALLLAIVVTILN